MAKATQHKINPLGSQSDARYQNQPSNPPRPGGNVPRPANPGHGHPLNHPIKSGDTSLAPGGSKQGQHSPYEKCSYITSPGQGSEPDAKFHNVSAGL